MDRVAAAVLVAIVCAVCIAASPAKASDVGATSSDSLEDRALEAQLSSYVADLDGIYGIAVVNLDDGRTAYVNANGAFPAASMYKLLVMYRVYEAIDRGYLSAADTLTIEDADAMQDEPESGFYAGATPTIAEALHAMITVSSNSSALALVRQIGGWEQVRSVAGSLGMADTYSLDGDLWSTPNDMAHFFQLLANRSLVSEDASRQMIDLLLQQTVNDRIPAPLPDWVAVAHKTGELDDARNDGGIVDGVNGRYVIVLMSRGGTPQDEVWVEAELSRIVYRAYGK